MPNHSASQLHRREFLQATGVATCSTITLMPACLSAAGRKLPKLSFAVVSDTHLGHQDKEHAARSWEAVAAELAEARVDFVLHLGDVVDGGREAQYAPYLQIKQKIGKSVYEIPGNHDPAEAFARHVREQIDTVVQREWLRLVLLNNARPDSHLGFLNDSQLELIERTCAAAAKAEQFVAIAMHVPAHANRHPDRGWYVHPNEGQTQLYHILDQHRDRVLCLMHGHFHNGIRGWNDRKALHEIVFPSVLYNRDRRLEAQMAPGYNLPEFRPGYTLATVEQGKLLLEYKPTGEEASQRKSLELSQV